MIDYQLSAPRHTVTAEGVADPNCAIAGPSSAAAGPAPDTVPEPVTYDLGYTAKATKRIALSRRTASKKSSRKDPSSADVPNRPWVFGYTFPGREEYALYFFTCAKYGCPVVMCNHPLINARVAEHLDSCGLIFDDEEDMIRKYATQRKSTILSSLSEYHKYTNVLFVVIADDENTSDGFALLEWARKWNCKILKTNNEEYLAYENFPELVIEEEFDRAASS